MPNPPSKGEMPPLANTHPLGGKTYVMRASTAATSLNKVLKTRNTKESPTAKETQGKVAEQMEPEAQRSVSGE